MAKVVEFKTAYGDRKRKPFNTEGDSLTQQHHAKDADIRNIIRQYDKTGLIGNVNKSVARYGDYSEINEYRDALDIVNSANESFAEIPADIREKFNNDAGAFFEFATNPKNHQEMVNLGLAESKTKNLEEVRDSKTTAEPPAPQEAGE